MTTETEAEISHRELKDLVFGGIEPVAAHTIGPFSWLASAIEVLETPEVAQISSGDDIDSYWEMVREVKAHHELGMRIFQRLALLDPEYLEVLMAQQAAKPSETTPSDDGIPFL